MKKNAEPSDQHFAAARTSTTSCLVYAGLSLFDWRAREHRVGPDRPLGGGPRNVVTWGGDYPAYGGGVEIELPQQTHIPKRIRNRHAPLLARRGASGAGFCEKAGMGPCFLHPQEWKNCTYAIENVVFPFIPQGTIA